MKRTLAVVAIFYCVAMGAIGQERLWLRYPAISPDGETVVFSYMGDLYRVPAKGGLATQLTIYDGHDYMPVWSKDGKSIAFASDRYGNFDIFLMPASGGQARRITYHSADDFPSDFSADNRYVLFNSTRTDSVQSAQFPSRSLPETYLAPVAGGKVQMLTTIALDEPHYSSSGKTIVYQNKKGGENIWRKHHTSSITRDICIYDVEKKTYSEPLTNFNGEDRSPIFSSDDQSIYYLSEKNGVFNLHKMSVSNPEQSQQLTHFEHHPVRFLTRSEDNLLCFSYHGEIYTMQEGGEPEKLAVQIYRDAQGPSVQQLSSSSGAHHMSVSPNGREIALVYRGEVFVTSVESGVTKQVTQTPEQERTVDFSPDGRSLVYSGERNGSWNIYKSTIVRDEEKYFFNATLLKEEPVVVTEAETFQPSFSPDGKEVAFLEERTTLRVVNLESSEIRTILPGHHNSSYADGDQYYQWSPDGKWFLVNFSLPGYWSSEVGLISSDGKSDVINLTQSGYEDIAPKWMMDGKMLLYFSNRDGLKSHANNGRQEYDAFAMFFTQKAYDRSQLNKEELALLKEKEKEDKDKDKDKDKGDEKKLKAIAMELDGIQDRKVRLTIHSSQMTDAVVTPDGEKLIYLTRFEKGYDLWTTNLYTRETKVLAKLGNRGGNLVLDKDGKNVFVLANGKLSRVDVDSGKATMISYKGEMTLDRMAERAYMFEHMWRQVKKKFYDTGLHGARWDFFKEAYAPFLPHINNSYDYAELLSEILGELNASHTGGRYRPEGGDGDDTASLGLYYDETWTGAGLKIAEIMPLSPVLNNDSKIKPGVIIEKLDGLAITPNANPWLLLNRKAGKFTLLSLFDEKSGERWDETVKPISSRAEGNLKYRRWVDSRRALAEKLSGGRIGYVHVRSMGDSSYRTVIEEVLGKHVTKEALIVDTRFNGGGDLVEDLSVFLSGKTYMDFVTPDKRVVGHEPQRRWRKPSVVLAGEGNYSDAHCFPFAFQNLGLGKVIGMPVPGTCTFVWWEQMIDGETVFGIPNMGVRDNEGDFLENKQLEPDMKVDNLPGALATGQDQQLEAAVKELLEQLAGK